jgi:hypothetical protein
VRFAPAVAILVFSSVSMAQETHVPDAPPPLPRKHGVVLESSLGALGFIGKFRHVAPPGPWLHTQLGYEPFRWMMVLVEGELAFSDTSIIADPTRRRAIPIFGFGGGLRLTARPTDRFSFYGQLSILGMKADVPSNSFAILGFRDAESVNASLGGRLGVEWHQIDRHLALGLAGGLRTASGFSRYSEASDTPLMWDGAATLRYTF